MRNHYSYIRRLSSGETEENKRSHWYQSPSYHEMARD